LAGSNTAGYREYDLLVIGSGISGLATAISAAENGASVAVISKESDIVESNTRYAQGGIVGTAEGDSPELLEKDIYYAGSGINFRDAVRLLAKEGPRLTRSFLAERIGVSFSLDADARYDLTQEAAHSIRRIYHAQDKTGDAIQNALVRYVSSLENVELFCSHMAVELITNTHNSSDPQEIYRPKRVVGAYVLDEEADSVAIFFAPCVVLATGGVGNLFLHTSNPSGATGDGIAMAYRIGAEVINSEYIQFHPTILYHRDRKRFLISESLRGEGARLMNASGEYFMERHHPELKDLAPRDEVARAIYREMDSDEAEYVRLDARNLNDVAVEKRFPAIYQTCLGLGIDPAREPIPVVPAAHYSCGGIKVNLNGATSIPGFRAVGENACTGVHGANRLASVSLLEGLLWGLRCGRSAASLAKPVSARLKRQIPDWVYPRAEEVFDSVLVHQDLRAIRSTMWNYAGIVRSRKSLLRALADLDYLSHRIEQFYRQAKLTRRIIELRNSVLTASLIVRAALANPRSTGCHYISPS
jgi:L-aspartate oxidase